VLQQVVQHHTKGQPQMSTSQRVLVATFGVMAILAVAGSALAAPGGNKSGGGGGGKRGGVDPTLAIASQQRSSVTFSVLVPDSGSAPGSMVVTVNCYDTNSSQNYSGSLNVAWSTNTVGFAGAFSPPSGEGCFAYVHVPGSTTALPGGTFSFVAP
jgi:hypothetical protein